MKTGGVVRAELSAVSASLALKSSLPPQVVPTPETLRGPSPYRETISRLGDQHPAAADHREDSMKFMLTFGITTESKTCDEAIARFKKTGGQPPAGVKFLGRWTAADFSGG
jgi:hypothetical protein